jgi:hypothetical protein
MIKHFILPLIVALVAGAILLFLLAPIKERHSLPIKVIIVENTGIKNRNEQNGLNKPIAPKSSEIKTDDHYNDQKIKTDEVTAVEDKKPYDMTEKTKERNKIVSDVNELIYYGGDWLTVKINSIEIVDGKYIQIIFIVSNPFEDEIRLRLNQPSENTYLVDNKGNSCDYFSSIGINGNQDHIIKPDEKINCSIVFKTPSISSGYITLRTEWTAIGRNFYGTKRFVVKNLLIPGR